MRCLISQQKDPYFNLAAEEYFLKNTEEELFMLYVNNPSIIAGKHQNLLGEINLVYARENNFILARRLSGGGTVYQDHGNLNFSFISNCPSLEKISYRRFTYPIVCALKSIGIDAEYSGRNDLLLENKKISGNAMHIYKKRVLCHGTLLFSTELKNLSSALKNNPDKYIDKSIKSIPSKVVNISEYLSKTMTMNTFISTVFEETCKYLNSPTLYTLSESDKFTIDKLTREKYSTWDWVLGYSPKYVFRNEIHLNGQSVKFEILVEKGIIKSYNFEEKYQINKYNVHIFNQLINAKHDYQSLLNLFNSAIDNNDLPDFSIKDFCNHLF